MVAVAQFAFVFFVLLADMLSNAHRLSVEETFQESSLVHDEDNDSTKIFDEETESLWGIEEPRTKKASQYSETQQQDVANELLKGKENGTWYCNKCQFDAKTCIWSKGKGECEDSDCYYPWGHGRDEFGAFGYDHEFNGEKRGFGFDQTDCADQAYARARFDGQPLGLEEDFNQGCVMAFYGPSMHNKWGTCEDHEQQDSSDCQSKSPDTPLRLTKNMATLWQLKFLREECMSVANKFGVGQKEIVLIVANTPRKQELEAWLNKKGKDVLQKSLGAYYMSGTATTIGNIKAMGVGLDKNFIREAYGLHTESGPKGGDVQGGALMGTGRVKALIFFQSYKTECHRCDIHSMVQICMGLESMGEMYCAFDEEKADKVLKMLAEECPKIYNQETGEYECRTFDTRPLPPTWGVLGTETTAPRPGH